MTENQINKAYKSLCDQRYEAELDLIEAAKQDDSALIRQAEILRKINAKIRQVMSLKPS